MIWSIRALHQLTKSNTCSMFTVNHVTIRPHNKPWYNNVLRALRRHRDRIFQKARSNNTFDSWQNYRECRNFSVSELKSVEEEYEVRQSSKLDSPSLSGHSWWQKIKLLLSLNKNTSIHFYLIMAKLFMKTILNQMFSTNISHPNAN